jgi:hypothetical protein
MDFAQQMQDHVATCTECTDEQLCPIANKIINDMFGPVVESVVEFNISKSPWFDDFDTKE